jgi:ankyrin repeat protein
LQLIFNNPGNKALYYACLCGHPNIVRYLLIIGTSFDISDAEDHRCYIASLTDGTYLYSRANILEIQNILSSFPKEGKICSRIFEAIESGNLPLFKKLIEQFQKVNGSKDALDLTYLRDGDG